MVREAATGFVLALAGGTGGSLSAGMAWTIGADLAPDGTLLDGWLPRISLTDAGADDLASAAIGLAELEGAIQGAIQAADDPSLPRLADAIASHYRVVSVRLFGLDGTEQEIRRGQSYVALHRAVEAKAVTLKADAA
jgi:hypothetical protein